MVSVKAHHDARRGWEAFGPNSLVFGWLSMEGILVCGSESAITRMFHRIRLGHFWRSLEAKRDGDGMSEGRVSRGGKELTGPRQVAQLIEAGCPA